MLLANVRSAFEVPYNKNKKQVSTASEKENKEKCYGNLSKRKKNPWKTYRQFVYVFFFSLTWLLALFKTYSHSNHEKEIQTTNTVSVLLSQFITRSLYFKYMQNSATYTSWGRQGEERERDALESFFRAIEIQIMFPF